MNHTVIITDPARDQLIASALWWSKNRSAEQAIRWYDGFLDALTTLTDSPNRFGFARENNRLPDEIREFYYGLGSRPTHRAIFRIDGNIVRVLSIRHLAQADLEPDEL